MGCNLQFGNPLYLFFIFAARSQNGRTPKGRQPASNHLRNFKQIWAQRVVQRNGIENPSNRVDLCIDVRNIRKNCSLRLSAHGIKKVMKKFSLMG